MDPLYLVLAEWPQVVSTAAPLTLSPPHVLMASERRDSLDVGSHSRCSKPCNGAGVGAAAETGGFLCRESKCEAQSSWSSGWRHVNTFIKNSFAADIAWRLDLKVPDSGAAFLASSVLWSPPSAYPALPASVSFAPLSSWHSAPPLLEWSPAANILRYFTQKNKNNEPGPTSAAQCWSNGSSDNLCICRLTPSLRFDLRAAGCSL